MELLFGPEGNIFWLIITFVILLTLLKRFAYGPIFSTLDKRSQKIQSAIDEAGHLKKEAENLFNDYKEKLKDSQGEAQKIIDQGKIVGEKLKQEIVEKANEQSKHMIEFAQSEINGKKDEALRDLRKNVAGWSVQIAESAIKKQLTDAEHKRLVEESISELSKIE